MRETASSMLLKAGTGVLTLAIAFAIGGGDVVAQESLEDDVTYARDVAPILQQNCQVCHQPGSIAPISLMTYDDARRYARRIRSKVAERSMPPWHIDRSVGIQDFKNDRGLTDAEIETIVQWVDNGSPFGDEADTPPPMEFPDPNDWQFAPDFGEPDMVFVSEAYDLDAVTQDKWYRPITETGITEERWVKAIEIRPVGLGSRRIVHHALAFLLQDEEQGERSAGSAEVTDRGAMGGPGLFMEWAVGKRGEIFPEGAGKLMMPGARILWEMHLHAIGEKVEAGQVELGVWLYPVGETPRNRTRLNMFDARGRSDLDIPPGEVAVTQDFHVLKWPARLENFQPHMHMRGKAMSMEAIYPDGRKRILSQVNNFQWQWHVNYIFADDAAPLLPAGTTLVITAWHDNTAENANNPDHTQWVGWGDRTVDEMAHAWVDVTYLTQEEYESEVAKREGKTADPANDEDGPPAPANR